MRRSRLKVWLCCALYGLLAVVAFNAYFGFFRARDAGYIRGVKFRSKGNGLSVLLVTIDALRADHVSANGFDLKITPTIDGLVSEGLNFSKAIVPIPRTTQSLASLLTGCYPYKTEVRALWGRLSQETITLTEVLKNAGYQTSALLANHLLHVQRGLSRGFDVYTCRSNSWDAAAITQEALERLKRIKSRKPFFFWVHYIDPHMPYYPPEEISRELDPDYRGKYETHFGGDEEGVGEKAYPSDLGKERTVYRNDLDEDTNRHVRKLYAAEVKYTDLNLRRLLAEVALRFGDKVITVVTADHGEGLGEHDYFYEHGDYVYNSQLRVPLVFRIPRRHELYRTGRIDEWVSLIDVFPTVLDLLGMKISSGHLEHLDGVSLIACWKGTELRPRPLFAESDYAFFPDFVKRRVRFDISGAFRAVVFNGWKLIWTPFQEPGMLYELYDIERDPAETTNLIEDEKEQAEELKKHLREWMALQSPDIRDLKATERDLEVLRSLGYIK